MHALAALQIVTTSHTAPLGSLSPFITWAIIVGGTYGSIRLVIDLLRLIRSGRIRLSPADSVRKERESQRPPD